MKFAVKITLALCLAAFLAPACFGWGFPGQLRSPDRTGKTSGTVADYCRRAEDSRGKDDHNGAIASYTTAIKMDKTGACGVGRPGFAQINRGAAFYSKGDYDAALADFNKALELSPGNIAAYINRGNAWYRKGENENALADYDKALSLDPGQSAARAGRRNAAAAIAKTKAAAAGAKAAERQKTRAEATALWERGHRCFKGGDYSGAIINWNKAISLNPDLETGLRPLLIKSYGWRASYYYRMGEYDKTIADFDEVLKLAPELDDVRKARDLAAQARSGRAGGRTMVTGGNLLTAPAALLQAQQQAAAANVSAGIPAPTAASPFSLGANPAPGAPMSAYQAQPSRSLGDQVNRKAGSGEGTGGNTGLGLIYSSLTVIIFLLAAVLAATLKRSGAITPGPGPAHTDPGAAPGGAFAGALSGVKTVMNGPLALIKKALSPPPITAPDKVPPRQPPGSAPSLISEGKYGEARAVLARKKDLDVPDYNLFLETYVKEGDFMRARLTASRISQGLRNQPDRKCEYAFYLTLADDCRHAGQDEVARQLRRIAVDGMLKAVSIKAAPALFYDLAGALEFDREYRLAMKLYLALMSGDRPYKDSAERYRKLREASSTRTGSTAPRRLPASEPVLPAAGPELVLNRYDLRNKLGEGEMGVVYEAWDRQRGRKVALKKMRGWLKKYPEEYKRFISEAKIVRKLEHPNIVGIQSIAEQGSDVYLVFDFVAGRPLSDIINFRDPVPLGRCKEIFRDVCEAVHYAHANNVIHRDLKPGNIMLDGAGRALVMDFGLASELREGKTRVTHNTTSGTPAYMAPEQFGGIVKKESDIFALGVCLYETLTGVRPYIDDGDLLKQKLDRDYRDITAVLPWLPAGMDKLMDRALEPEPSQRFADALDLYEALKKL